MIKGTLKSVLTYYGNGLHLMSQKISIGAGTVMFTLHVVSIVKVLCDKYWEKQVQQQYFSHSFYN